MEEKTLEHGQGERTIGIALFPIFSIPDRDTSLFQRHHFISLSPLFDARILYTTWVTSSPISRTHTSVTVRFLIGLVITFECFQRCRAMGAILAPTNGGRALWRR